MVNNTTKPEQLTCIVHDLVIIQCLKSACVAMSGKRWTSDLNWFAPTGRHTTLRHIRCALLINGPNKLNLLSGY